MDTCQCEGCQMRQNSDVLLEETTAFWRCPFIMVSLNIHNTVRMYTIVKTSRKEDEGS